MLSLSWYASFIGTSEAFPQLVSLSVHLSVSLSINHQSLLASKTVCQSDSQTVYLFVHQFWPAGQSASQSVHLSVSQCFRRGDGTQEGHTAHHMAEGEQGYPC